MFEIPPTKLNHSSPSPNSITKNLSFAKITQSKDKH